MKTVKARLVPTRRAKSSLRVVAAPSFNSEKATKDLEAILSKLGEKDPLGSKTRMINFDKVIKAASKKLGAVLSKYRSRIDGIAQEWATDIADMPADMKKRGETMIATWEKQLAKIDKVITMKEASPLEMGSKVRAAIKLLTP